MDRFDRYGAHRCPSHPDELVIRDGITYCGQCGTPLGTPAPPLEWTWSDGFPSEVTCAAISADGRAAAAADDYGSLRSYGADGERLWEAEFGDPPRPRKVVGLALSPDGGSLVAALDDGFLRCYDREGQLAWEQLTRNRQAALSFSEDGSRIIVSPGLLLDSSGEKVAEPERPPLMGAEHATGFFASQVKGPIGLYEWTGRCRWSRSGKDVISTAFSPDGQRVAIGGEDGHVRCMTAHGEKVWEHFVEPIEDGGPILDHVNAISLGGPGGVALLGCTEGMDLVDGSVVAVRADGKRLWRRPIAVPVAFVGWSRAAGVGYAANPVYAFLFQADGKAVGRLGKRGSQMRVAVAPEGRGLVGWTERTVGFLGL